MTVASTVQYIVTIQSFGFTAYSSNSVLLYILMSETSESLKLSEGDYPSWIRRETANGKMSLRTLSPSLLCHLIKESVIFPRLTVNVA